jgi:transposase
MAEFGMVAVQRDVGLKALIAIIADSDDVRLPALARLLLALQLEHLRQIEARIAALDGRSRSAPLHRDWVSGSC